MKVTPSFCFAFKIPDDPTISNIYGLKLNNHITLLVYVIQVKLKISQEIAIVDYANVTGCLLPGSCTMGLKFLFPLVLFSPVFDEKIDVWIAQEILKCPWKFWRKIPWKRRCMKTKLLLHYLFQTIVTGWTTVINDWDGYFSCKNSFWGRT